MKKKIKAGSVEELLEIVKAVQNGEEPEEALNRMKAESAPLADSPKSHPENDPKEEKSESKMERKGAKRRRHFRDAAREADESGREEIFKEDEIPVQPETSGESPEDQEDDGFEDDEFEKILEEDEQTSASFRALLERCAGGVQKISGAFGGVLQSRKKQEKIDPEDELELEEEPLTRPEAGNAEAEESGPGEETAQPEQEPAEPDREEHDSEEEQGPDSEEEDEEQERRKEEGKIIDRLLDTGTAEETAEEKEEEAPENEPERKLRSGKLSGLSNMKWGASLKEFWEGLVQRGISRKELFMIGTVAVLAVLIVVIIVNSVSSSMERRQKMEHVTADPGLTVTVEDEPEAWCSSYPVRLGVSAGRNDLSSVTVNGVSCTPDENGIIEVDASDYLLELSAETQDGILNAQIEIPMIDAQAPAVNVTRDGSSITVSAADGRSGVSKIWCAEVHSNDYISIPLYEEYTGPLTYEADTMYYFYAVDHAGNESQPIATTAETAESLAFAEEEVALFPGDTVYLTLEESPEGAILNGLQFESSNPEVATVDENGTVTAVAQGSTAIRVSADGVGQASCAVAVSDEQTVTISAIGDCTLGTDESFNTTTDFNAFDTVNGHSYFFANVRDILENDDATFANFEGTLTTADTREAKEYAFKGDPSYTEILQDGSIDVVTLANNHSSDYGAQSLTDTKGYLTEAGIDYCTGDEIAIKDVNGIKTAFIGIYVLDEGIAKAEQVQSTIAQAKADGAQLVIVGFHWGTEKAEQPDETQISLAHTAVDSGADLVVGHHPHVLQGIEKYNGKYIAYSLGNFCFGGNSAPSDMDTIIFRQTFSVTKDGTVGEGEVEIIPCSISSVSGYNNYQPTPAQGTEAERIINRLNEYSSAFGQTFAASTGLE